ncbi:hypothetical protein [Modestobacter sp. SYSU DS0657]
MTYWVGSISFEQRDNWQICKRESLFGSNTLTALGARAGDELFIWGSRQGWLARCRVTQDARRPAGVEEVPWPEPERYTALIPIEVLDEPTTPVFMSGSDIEQSVGIGTIQLPRFPRIDIQRAEHLTVLLGDVYQRHGAQAAAASEQARSATPEDPLLRSLMELKVDRQLGKPAPYQQLVLLWAISKAVQGRQRVQPFSDARDELGTLLAPFAVGESQPEPELPWFALRKSPWWQLFGEPAGPVSRGGRDFVRSEDPVAGLARNVHDRVRSDDAFRDRAVELLTAPLEGHAALPSTLSALFEAVPPDLPERGEGGPAGGDAPALDEAPEPQAPDMANRGYVVGRIYDRGELHEAARAAGLPSGNRTSGITVVGEDLCVFWNPFKGLYANQWLDEPREFTYSGEGSTGDQTETGGNARLIEHEQDERPVLVFLKTRRDGSAWLHLGPYLVSEHARGDSRDTDGDWRRDLRFRFTALADVPGTVPAQLPDLPTAPPPPAPTEGELWEALQRRNETGERRRATRIQRNKRVSDPLKTDYVIQRAIDFGGACELCGQHPGWVGDDGRPHYQAHHIDPDIDLVDWIAALCGTCHDRMHHATDRVEAAIGLLGTVQKRQRELGRPLTQGPARPGPAA